MAALAARSVLAHFDEGTDDIDAHGNCSRGLLRMLAAMRVPCSVNA